MRNDGRRAGGIGEVGISPDSRNDTAPDTFVLHPIGRRDEVSLRGWYDAAHFSSSLDMTASLPEITFAGTAHEAIAAQGFRKRAGEAGLELGREPTGARPTS